MTLRAAPLLAVFVFAMACGDDKGGGTEDSTGSATSEPGTGTGTSDDSTSATEATTSGSETGTGTGTSPTTGGSETGTSPTTGGSETGTSATTGVLEPNFERFTLKSAAGPCPPNSDCDGFVELLANRMLRVEKFGDVGNPVTEIEISEEDFAGAAGVFDAPELVALLDGPDPVCNPPTDIFESMEVVLDGQLHDAATTACDDAPLVAARELAMALQTKYVP
jgi:hypothetical protein